MANGFNPLASLSQGLQFRDQLAQNQQRGQVRGLQEALSGQIQAGGFNPASSQEFQQLAALDPNSANASLSIFQELDNSRQKAFFQDARKGRELLEANDFDGFLNLTSNRLNEVQKLGGDPSDIASVLQTFNSGDVPGTIAQLRAAESAGMQVTDSSGKPFLTDPRLVSAKIAAGKPQKTASQKDFETFQRLITEDPEKAKQFGRKVGFIRETEKEKADIKVSEAERKAIAKANVTRKQGFIDSGIEAADGATNVRRALNLLDEVKTGGFDNLALKARRFFGVEGADEGEVSNLMGKAVLSQLKPIFGAAFTVRESDKLDALEAGFSKSSANNKRLLENALKIINRAARRGIAAAEDQEGKDSFTANEIREALAFKIEDKLTEPTDQAQPIVTGQQTPVTVGRFTVEVQ